eukprot:jgi/Mesvir1/9677/Mv12160-RA.1
MGRPKGGRPKGRQLSHLNPYVEKFSNNDGPSKAKAKAGPMENLSELVDASLQFTRVLSKKGVSQATLSVCVRCRPLTKGEKAASCFNIARIMDNRIVVVLDPEEGRPRQPGELGEKRSKEKRYIFDAAYGEGATNYDLYRRTVKPMTIGLFRGLNATVFAYGATGSGKTYTMVGSQEDPGLMVLSINEIFDLVSKEREKHLEVHCSYLEVYNEMIYDLLTPGGGALDLREDPERGPVVAGLSQIKVKTTERIMELLRAGNQRRKTEATDANMTSSRSHAVLEVVVSKSNHDHYVQQTYTAKLALVDLAGSERGSETNNRGDQLRDGANINRSLLALANCINALGKRKKKGFVFVPFRNSKLTRLLKDGLCGNSRTTMIAAISPSNNQYHHTVNTLKYANRAKEIKTNFKANEGTVETHIADYKRVIDNLQTEVKTLRNALHGKTLALGGGTLTLPPLGPNGGGGDGDSINGGNSLVVDQELLNQLQAAINENVVERVRQQKEVLRTDETLVEHMLALHDLKRRIRAVKGIPEPEEGSEPLDMGLLGADEGADSDHDAADSMGSDAVGVAAAMAEAVMRAAHDADDWDEDMEELPSSEGGSPELVELVKQCQAVKAAVEEVRMRRQEIMADIADTEEKRQGIEARISEVMGSRDAMALIRAHQEQGLLEVAKTEAQCQIAVRDKIIAEQKDVIACLWKVMRCAGLDRSKVQRIAAENNIVLLSDGLTAWGDRDSPSGRLDGSRSPRGYPNGGNASELDLARSFTGSRAARRHQFWQDRLQKGPAALPNWVQDIVGGGSSGDESLESSAPHIRSGPGGFIVRPLPRHGHSHPHHYPHPRHQGGGIPKAPSPIPPPPPERGSPTPSPPPTDPARLLKPSPYLAQKDKQVQSAKDRLKNLKSKVPGKPPMPAAERSESAVSADAAPSAIPRHPLKPVWVPTEEGAEEWSAGQPPKRVVAADSGTDYAQEAEPEPTDDYKYGYSL